MFGPKWDNGQYSMRFCCWSSGMHGSMSAPPTPCPSYPIPKHLPFFFLSLVPFLVASHFTQTSQCQPLLCWVVNENRSETKSFVSAALQNSRTRLQHVSQKAHGQRVLKWLEEIRSVALNILQLWGDGTCLTKAISKVQLWKKSYKQVPYVLFCFVFQMTGLLYLEESF